MFEACDACLREFRNVLDKHFGGLSLLVRCYIFLFLTVTGEHMATVVDMGGPVLGMAPLLATFQSQVAAWSWTWFFCCPSPLRVVALVLGLGRDMAGPTYTSLACGGRSFYMVHVFYMWLARVHDVAWVLSTRILTIICLA